MAAARSTEPMTARGRSRCGLALSPPSCTACSKPRSEKTMPAPGMAMRMALARIAEAPGNEESAPGREVVRMEVGEQEHHDGEHRDEHLPRGDPGVGVGQPADP